MSGRATIPDGIQAHYERPAAVWSAGGREYDQISRGAQQRRSLERAAQVSRSREDSANTNDLAKLFARLDADPEQAALEYEHLRRALIRFFDWRGGWPADECADEALDRLMRRLRDTAVHDVHKYAHGIARLVLLERRRAPVLASIDDVPEATLVAPQRSDAHSDLQGCFERCLTGLPEDSRQLLLRYYEGQCMEKIVNRRRLASMLGITENALRNRVQRLRDRLQLCVHACVGDSVHCTR